MRRRGVDLTEGQRRGLALGPGIAHGERHGSHKLTDSTVEQIRRSSENAAMLAERYGVARRTVADARARRTWRHLP
jgi:hypothetical protein